MVLAFRRRGLGGGVQRGVSMGSGVVIASRIITAWDFDPSVLGGCVALAIAYLYLTPNPFPSSPRRGRRALSIRWRGTKGTADNFVGKGNQKRKNIPAPSDSPSRSGRGRGLGLEGRGWELGLFLLGDLLMLLALISPLDVLADDYLFSAHMLQHM